MCWSTLCKEYATLVQAVDGVCEQKKRSRRDPCPSHGEAAAFLVARLCLTQQRCGAQG